MTERSITEQRFAELADSYGGDLQRWPAAERAAARQLLDSSPSAQRVLQHAAALDATLHALPAPPPPSARLRTRLLAAAPQPRVSLLRSLWAELGGLRYAGPAFAASLTLGIMLAVWQTGIDEPADAELAIVLDESDYQDWLP